LNTGFTSTRRTFCKHLGAAAATTFFLGAHTLSAHADSHQDATFRHSSGAGLNVLLVHGAWVDASSWILVIPLLQAQGYHVLAVQNPLSSLADDVTVTRQALASLSGPTIVAGHSYGGAVMTNAGTGAPNLHSLVYIAAVAPLEGESVMGIAGQFPTPPITAHVVPSYRQGYTWVDPAFFSPRLCARYRGRTSSSVSGGAETDQASMLYGEVRSTCLENGSVLVLSFGQ